MNTYLLYGFILLNVLIIGALLIIGARAYAAHVREKNAPETPASGKPAVQLSPAMREQLLKRAEKQFQSQIDRIALELQQSLKITAVELDGKLKNMGTEILEDEMKRYRAGLDELRAAADTKLNAAQSAVERHHEELDTLYAQRKSELEAKLSQEIAAEKTRLQQLIDTRLNDAVASFLLETMGHNVDLGAQAPFLTALLEEHKETLKKELS